jgi:phage terminase large subunit GpA-like protein
MVSTKHQNRKNDLPQWLLQGLQALKPPEKLTVSEWADKYRILDSKTSAEPGRWVTDRTPYLRAIMDAFKDPEIEEIIFVKPTQVGGTETLNNIIGYIISQDQSPTLVVYPTLELAEYTSKNRLQPLIELSEATRKHYNNRESKDLELQFTGMYLCLSGANSPASLATRPIRFLLMDELDKYPTNSGREADPRSLARERTKTFATNKKIISASTPTLVEGPIWQEWLNAHSQYKYYVPCPHCGDYQELIFQQIKWNKEAKTDDEIRNSAYYECTTCKGIISDRHKPLMLKNGEWISLKKEGKRKTAFHLNALYSPWVRFGDVASEFKRSENFPDLLMNFVNSWLAEPWKATQIKLDHEVILERQSKYNEATVPNEAFLLTAGVDVQKTNFYYTIRAWGGFMSSWNIAHGIVDTWDEIEYIMSMPFRNEKGELFQVQICAIDSGDRTDEVYDFCAQNYDWAVPVKGSSRDLLKRFSISSIDRIGSKAHGMNLYIVDGGQYKDMIAGRLKRTSKRGGWFVYKGCDIDYCKQICAEEKVKEKKGDRVVYKWKTKGTKTPNHYLDCEVYASFAADLLQVRYVQTEDIEPYKRTIQADQINLPIQEVERHMNKEKSWIDSDRWLSNKGSWIR